MARSGLFAGCRFLLIAFLLTTLIFTTVFHEKCFASERQNYLIKHLNLPRQKGRDSWLAVDKYRHLLVSAMVVGLVADVLRVEGRQPRVRAAWFSVGVSLSLGVGKELYDRSHPGHVASWRDLAADLAGIALGVFCFVRR